MQEQAWNPGGRRPGWRIGMALAGALLAGAGVALFLWPALLIWLLSGLLVLAGVFCVLSAVLARGATPEPPRWQPPESGSR